MKMAKASAADMAMAVELVQALDILGQQHFPSFPKAIEQLGPDDEREPFDSDNDAHCGRAMRHLLDILDRGSLFRVIWGMSVLLDPANKVVDPSADTLEHHPEVVAALAAMKEGATR